MSMFLQLGYPFFCFGTLSLLCIINFIFKIKSVTLVYKSLAPIGLTFNVIAIFTGSVWGQPTWGTWWAWDARLTSMLILMFFYIAFILSYKFIKDPINSSRICTGISIAGLINLVVIKYSVIWWSTLHQPSSVNLTGETTIHISMLNTSICDVISFFVVLCVNFSNEI